MGSFDVVVRRLCLQGKLARSSAGAHTLEVYMNGPLKTIRKDVRDLISINEKLQSALVQGDHFTDDETTIIRLCAGELLESAMRKTQLRRPG